MDHTILMGTFVALLLFFAGVEAYKSKNHVKGQIIGFHPSNPNFGNILGSRMKVKLSDGRIVEAEAEQCTVCMGHFSVGDEVRLVKYQDKYVVHLPLFLSARKACQS